MPPALTARHDQIIQAYVGEIRQLPPTFNPNIWCGLEGSTLYFLTYVRAQGSLESYGQVCACQAGPTKIAQQIGVSVRFDTLDTDVEDQDPPDVPQDLARIL